MMCPFEPAEKQALLEAPSWTRAGRHAGGPAGNWPAPQAPDPTSLELNRQWHEIDPKLLEILVCPLTKAPLLYDRERQELISTGAGLAYPIRDGIPIMLPDEARELSEAERLGK